MSSMTKIEAESAPATEVTELARPVLMSVEDAKALDVSRMADLFKAHLNPGQYHFMKLLGFHKVKVERAEGMYYIDQNGRRILDFFGGFGSLAFGHNHPRNLEARKKFQEENIRNARFNTVLIGNREKINFNDLKKYGEVQELTLDELFG